MCNAEFTTGHFLEVKVPHYEVLLQALNDNPFVHSLYFSHDFWFFILDVKMALDHLLDYERDVLSSGERYLIVLFREILFRRKGSSVSALIGLV